MSNVTPNLGALQQAVSSLGTASAANTGTTAGTVPVLLAGGTLPASVIPADTITEVFVVASQAAMLALSGAGVGDIAVRTDTSISYILQALPPATLGNWVVLLSPTSPVQTVAGRTGNVTLVEADVENLATDLAARLVAASNLSDLANAGTARTNLGLGTAATSATSAFDAAGSATTAANAVNASLLTHESATATHGVSGAIVGTTDTQTLTNKSLSGSSNTFTNIANTSLTWASQTTKTFFAAPGSGDGTPSFRALLAVDLPNQPSITSSGTIPTIATGAGAGGGATATVVSRSTNLAGAVTLTTGTLPLAASTLATLTFANGGFPNGATVIFSPANALTQALGVGATVLAVANATTVVLTSGTIALGAGVYSWNYIVVGN